MPVRMPRRAGLLKSTGQITQYNSELDDGFYQKGLTPRYEVLSTGQYSGTVNIDLIHKTAATIAFAATTPGTITDSGNDLAMFKTGETIVISGSVSNDGVYTVSTGNVAGTIRTTEATVFEAVGATVSIAKRVAHSNNCVQDLVTGLMWARYPSSTYGVMGTGGDGKMPWAGQLYDIYQWCAAANAAALGGYMDWRISNKKELDDLCNMEAPNALPDAVAFPSWSTTDFYWSSNTKPTDGSIAIFADYSYGSIRSSGKATAYYAALVRGG